MGTCLTVVAVGGLYGVTLAIFDETTVESCFGVYLICFTFNIVVMFLPKSLCLLTIEGSLIGSTDDTTISHWSILPPLFKLGFLCLRKWLP